jgi:ribose/xylose/arabinose/galactoside ABC-type transport system permease subunit
MDFSYMTNSTVTPSPKTKAPPALKSLMSALGPLGGLVFVFLLFVVLVHRHQIDNPGTLPFANRDNIELILLQTAVVGTAALGMSLIIISGGIDLSIGSSIALGTVVIAYLLEHHASPVLAALGGIATCAACGLVISGLVTGLKLTPFIVTLGMLTALRGMAIGLAHGQSLDAPSSWMNSLLTVLPDDKKWMLFPPGVWLMVLLAVAVSALLRYTRFGRHIFAIGSSEQTARLCGVAIAPTKILIYTLAGALVGVAGVLQFGYLTIGDSTTATGYELSAIAAVVIGGASLSGGQGSIFGTLIGAMIMTTIAVGCTKLDYANWVQQIVTGGIIVFAVALDQWRHRKSV